MQDIKDGGPAFSIASDTIGHCAGMTLRQYAAIKLKVPDSGTDWLDEMIVKSLRNDFAAKAMQSSFGNPMETCPQGKEYIAMHCYKMADVMLETGEK